MVPASSSQNGSTDEQPANCGVLLRLRILHHSNKYPKGKSKGKEPAYFLGTVSKYRSVHRVVPPSKGRPCPMPIGCYQVRFDHGGTVQLSPDEVITGVNLFHEQQQMQLGFRPRPPGEKAYPVISQVSEREHDDAKVGRQLLIAHNNWPLAAGDIDDLDKEREEFAKLGEKGPKPSRVNPTWFNSIVPTSTSNEPVPMKARVTSNAPSPAVAKAATARKVSVEPLAAATDIARKDPTKLLSSLPTAKANLADIELSSLSADKATVSSIEKQRKKPADAPVQQTGINTTTIATVLETSVQPVGQAPKAAKKSSPTVKKKDPVTTKKSSPPKESVQELSTKVSISQKALVEEKSLNPTKLQDERPSQDTKEVLKTTTAKATEEKLTGKASTNKVRASLALERQPPAKTTSPPKSLKELKEQRASKATPGEVRSPKEVTQQPSCVKTAKIMNGPLGTKTTSPPKAANTASSTKESNPPSIEKKLSLAAQGVPAVGDMKEQVVSVEKGALEKQKQPEATKKTSPSQAKKPQPAAAVSDSGNASASTPVADKATGPSNPAEKGKAKKTSPNQTAVQAGSKTVPRLPAKASVSKKPAEAAAKQTAPKVDSKKVIRRRPLPKAFHKKTIGGKSTSTLTAEEVVAEDSTQRIPPEGGKSAPESIANTSPTTEDKASSVTPPGGVSADDVAENENAAGVSASKIATSSKVLAPSDDKKGSPQSKASEESAKESTSKRKGARPVGHQKPTKRKREAERSLSNVQPAEEGVHAPSHQAAREEESRSSSGTTEKAKIATTQESEQEDCERFALSLNFAVAKASKAAAAAARSSEKELAVDAEKSSFAIGEISEISGKANIAESAAAKASTPSALSPEKVEGAKATRQSLCSAEGKAKSRRQEHIPGIAATANFDVAMRLEVARSGGLLSAEKEKKSESDKGVAETSDRTLETSPLQDQDSDKLCRHTESKDDKSRSSAAQSKSQKNGPLDFLARVSVEKARNSSDTHRHHTGTAPAHDALLSSSGAEALTMDRNDPKLASDSKDHLSKLATQYEASSPVPQGKGRPSPSRRGLSDGSGDSIHRAGTPKSHNMAAEDRSGRGRACTGAPKLPDLKDAPSRPEGISNDGLAMPHLSQNPDEAVTADKKPTEKEPPFSGEKRTAEESKMEPPKAIKRQRSVPTRPPLIINRQRSTGSRLSFADEVQFEPASSGNVPVERRPAAPPVLRNTDRQQSLESLQPPSVIRAGDRQFSVESYASLRSQESAMQALTPNSRLTPSMLAQPSVLSPSADTPNTERMEELYDQLDQYMESPSQKALESPGPRSLPFRPRPMNAKRQGSSASMASMTDSHSELKLPPSQLEREKEKVSLQNEASDSSSDRPRDIPNRQNRGRIGSGLTPLAIPTDGEIDQLSKVSTPTTQIRKSPRGGLRGAVLRQSPQHRPMSARAHTTGHIPMQTQQQKVHRMVSEGAGPAPMQAESLKAWLEGSGESGFEEDLRAPQLNQFNQVTQSPVVRGLSNQGLLFQSQYGMPPTGHNARARMAPSQPDPYERRQMSYDTGAQFKQRMPVPVDTYSQMRHQQPHEQKLQRQSAQGSQLRRKKVVELGHPREEVVEGQQIYSRHTLLLWGAHKSDVCPVNGNPRDGCDSIVYMHSADDVPKTKDDLQFIQFKCSLRNGGGALFSNYQRSQHRNAPHSYPVRIFRKTKTANGISGLRYDGLYHVAAIHDDRGRPRSEPTTSSKTFSFLLKRNRAGPAGDQNQFMVEDLWELVQRDGSPPHPSQRRGGGGQMGHLRLPHLSHGGGRGFRGGGGGHQHGSNMMGGSGMGEPAMSPRPAGLERKTSAEVSLIHIRYYDDAQQQQQQQQQPQQPHYSPHVLNHRPQAMLPQRAPMMVQQPPAMAPWPTHSMAEFK